MYQKSPNRGHFTIATQLIAGQVTLKLLHLKTSMALLSQTDTRRGVKAISLSFKMSQGTQRGLRPTV